MDETPELHPKLQEGVRSTFKQLDVAGRKLGLYVDDAHVHVGMAADDEPGIPSGLSICVDYLVGDRAFSATVMDPESAAFATEIDGLATDAADADWQALEDKFRKGEHWKPDDES